MIETKDGDTAHASGIELPQRRKKNKKRRKRRKGKYSNELGDVQRLDRTLTKSERRIARAVLSAIDSWDDNSNRSASKKRDGALKDALANSSKAYSKYYKGIKGLPKDLGDLYGGKGWPAPLKLLNDLLPY